MGIYPTRILKSFFSASSSSLSARGGGKCRVCDVVIVLGLPVVCESIADCSMVELNFLCMPNKFRRLANYVCLRWVCVCVCVFACERTHERERGKEMIVIKALLEGDIVQDTHCGYMRGHSREPANSFHEHTHTHTQIHIYTHIYTQHEAFTHACEF